MHRSGNGKARQSRRPGRPPVHGETWSKVSVVLFDRQIRQIDRLTRRIGNTSGWHTNRAVIIRAALDAVFDRCTPPCAVASEADLRKELAKRLSSPR